MMSHEKNYSSCKLVCRLHVSIYQQGHSQKMETASYFNGERARAKVVMP